ncbi:hypothetical protein JHK82_044306 [Glycine max]|nr:hypothetical protein JHK82_044306 [Glycine max]
MGIGVFLCLPVDLFKTTKIFIPYIATIFAAITVATSTYTHHLDLMARAFLGPTRQTLKKKITLFSSTKQGVSSWLSLYATIVGCLGSSIVSSFTYQMLREPNDSEHEFISLWIVSIFFLGLGSTSVTIIGSDGTCWWLGPFKAHQVGWCTLLEGCWCWRVLLLVKRVPFLFGIVG